MSSQDSQRVLHLNPDAIMIEADFNIRAFDLPENIEHVASLSRSIVAMGLQNPLTIRYVDGKPTLVDGECRLRAIRLARSNGANIATVACVEEQSQTSEVHRTASLLTRNAGKVPNIIERGAAVVRLLQMGQTIEQIAEYMGCNTPQVGNILQVYEAPQGIREMIILGQISGSFALEAIRKYGDSAEKHLQKAVKHAQKAGAEKATQKHLVAVSAGIPGGGDRANPMKLRRTDANQMLSALISMFQSQTVSKANIETVFEDLFGESWRSAIRSFELAQNAALHEPRRKKKAAVATDGTPEPPKKRGRKPASFSQNAAAA